MRIQLVVFILICALVLMHSYESYVAYTLPYSYQAPSVVQPCYPPPDLTHEFTTKLHRDGQWICPAGWSSTGCSLEAHGDTLGLKQCQRLKQVQRAAPILRPEPLQPKPVQSTQSGTCADGHAFDVQTLRCKKNNGEKGKDAIVARNIAEPQSQPQSQPSGSHTPLNYLNTGKNVYALTWYSFQDNTPTNSANSSSGRTLVPYVSVAPPFRMLKKFGGPLEYGDWLFCDFLQGRKMPNGVHTGYVRVDDFCGDNNDDSYCFYKVPGESNKVPGLDIYIGDITTSGYSTTGKCDGPAGDGVTKVQVYRANSPIQANLRSDGYGTRAKGTGRCGDWQSAKREHGNCHFYKAPSSSVKWCPKN